MIKAVYFDFFDVIRTDPTNAWLRKRGLKLDGIFADTSRQFDLGMIDLETYHRTYAGETGEPYENVRDEFANGNTYDHDVISLIRDVKKNYLTGLISNARAEFISEALATEGIADIFDDVTVSSSFGFAKPDPDIFHHALNNLQVQPAEAIFIDDNPHNIVGAEAVGMVGIQFVTLSELKNDLDKHGVSIR